MYGRKLALYFKADVHCVSMRVYEAYLPGLVNGGGDGEYWDEHDAPGVVIVLVHEPERAAEHLEDVERRQHLQHTPTTSAHVASNNYILRYDVDVFILFITN